MARHLTDATYLAWLRQLSVRYRVLTMAVPDYSLSHERALLESGRSGLPVVFRTPTATVYEVPAPLPIVTGPGHPQVKALTGSTITLRLHRPGQYRLEIRYSPYLFAPESCVTEGRDGMTVLTAPSAGTVRVAFTVSAAGALAALTGSRTTCPATG